MKRMLWGLTGSAFLAAALTTVTAPAASAASTCSGTHLGNWRITGGYISVYYNSSTGYNCAMTHTDNPGVAQHIMVEISNGSSSDKDSGTYRYYAGPVRVYAPHTCISFEGQIGNGAIEGVVNAYCD